MMIKQLAYVSRATVSFSRDDLKELMRKARRRNQEISVTGLLLCQLPMFMQVLEGPGESVDGLLERILQDTQHTDLEVIYTHEQAERQFARWRMACKILGEGLPEEFKALDERVKNILRAAKPDGVLAHQILLEFRDAESQSFDI